MDINQHRKALVRALIHGLRNLDGHELAFDVEFEGKHFQGDRCAATNLFFPDGLSEKQITISNDGPLWMGLWLDCRVLLHDGENAPSRKKYNAGYSDHGNTLFPRWLAEVLNHELELDIDEKDIYDQE